MKTNKNKFLILALSSTAFLSLVGSVTGTMAWYQYSTRSTAGIIGSSKAVTQNLQISTDGTNWKSDLSSADIYNGAKAKTSDYNVGTAVTPLTSGNIAKDAALSTLYGNPVYQNFGDYSVWSNENTSYSKYLTFDLYFRFVKNENSVESFTEKEVKLTDLTIQGYKEDGNEDADLTKAMRVHFSNADDSTYALASNNGGTLDTNGKLDLNGDGKLDNTAKYEFETDGQDGVYGEGQQVAYSKDDLLATIDTDGKLSNGVTLATTTDTGASNKLTVTVWLEGWETVNDNAVWDADTFSKGTYNIGLQFACDAD